MDEISAGVSRTPANELMSQPHRLVRNISYSVAANLVSFLVGVAVVLLVPKLVGVEEYGYFQLFLFFIGYVGFFHFGWADASSCVTRENDGRLWTERGSRGRSIASLSLK